MFNPPLKSFTVLQTGDVATARSALMNTYGASTFEVRERNDFNVNASFVKVGGISLSYCDYASEVTLSFPEAQFVRQHICLSGHARIQRGGQTEDLSTASWSGLVPPGMPVDYAYSADTRQLVMWLDLARLSKKLEALLGDERAKLIRWSGKSDRRGQAMATMKRAVAFLASELEVAGEAYSTETGFLEIEDFIMVRFLYAHDHEQLLDLVNPPARASSPQLRRIEEYIIENWLQPLSVETLANVSGVSARSVFRYFHSVHGCTPQVFRKRIRLNKAREKLASASPGTTVIGVALACGFQSLGHFASDYREFFGELPSATLASSSVGPHIRSASSEKSGTAPA